MRSPVVGTKITATAAWNPQADPAERANRQVQESLRAAVTTVGSYDEWDKALPHICFGLNAQASSVTGYLIFRVLDCKRGQKQKKKITTKGHTP